MVETCFPDTPCTTKHERTTSTLSELRSLSPSFIFHSYTVLSSPSSSFQTPAQLPSSADFWKASWLSKSGKRQNILIRSLHGTWCSSQIKQPPSRTATNVKSDFVMSYNAAHRHAQSTSIITATAVTHNLTCIPSVVLVVVGRAMLNPVFNLCFVLPSTRFSLARTFLLPISKHPPD